MRFFSSRSMHTGPRAANLFHRPAVRTRARLRMALFATGPIGWCSLPAHKQTGSLGIGAGNLSPWNSACHPRALMHAWRNACGCGGLWSGPWLSLNFPMKHCADRWLNEGISTRNAIMGQYVRMCIYTSPLATRIDHRLEPGCWHRRNLFFLFRRGVFKLVLIIINFSLFFSCNIYWLRFKSSCIS